MNQPIINQDISPPWGSCENRSVIDSIVSGKDIKELVAKPQSGGNLWKAVDVRSCCFRGLYYIYYIQGVPGPPYQKKTEDDSSSSGRKKTRWLLEGSYLELGYVKSMGKSPQKRAIIGATPKFPSTYLGYQLPWHSHFLPSSYRRLKKGNGEAT